VKHVSFESGVGLQVDVSVYSSLGNVTELYVGAFAPSLLGNSPPTAADFQAFVIANPSYFTNVLTAATNVLRYDQKVVSALTLSQRYTTGTLATGDIGTLVTIANAATPCAVCVFAVDDSGAIGLDLAAVFEAPTVVASSFVVFDTVYIKPGTVSGDIVGQSSGINNLVATFEYNAGPKFFHAFAVDSVLDKNPLTILGDSSLSSAVVSLNLSASLTSGSSTITVTSLINTTTKEIEQIPDSGVYVYIIGSNRTTGSATALSGKYDYQYAQVFPVSRVVAGSVTNVIQYATTNEWTLDAQVTYLAGKKQSLYGPTQGLSVYGVFDTDAVSFERVGLGGVSWVSTIKTPQWVAGDYKIQGPGTALAVSESGQGSKFATLKGAGMTNVIKFSTDWTFAYWVKHIGATGTGSNESPNFGGLSVQAGQVHVRVQRQSATQFRVFSPTLGASVSHTLATGLTTSMWNHVAVTWTAGTKTLNYLVNNVLAATHVNTDVTRTTFGAEFSLAIAEAITGTQTGVYFDDLRVYNRVLTSGEFLALNDIQNYFHTFGTVLPVESRDALVTAMKSARVTETETSATGYSSVNTTFRNQPMKYVLDKTGTKFPATTVNYVHAHAIASGATQNPELFDADKLGVVSVLKPASNEIPHLTIPNSYWSRFYKQSYADGAAFSSVANIDSVYAPIAFTTDVDLTNVKDFFTAHRTVLANSNAERYAVKQLEETVLTHAYANVDDPTDTMVITEGGEYQVVIVGKDVDGNVGVGLLETGPSTTFNKTLVYGTNQHGALGVDSLAPGSTTVTPVLTLSDQLSNLPSGQKISAIYTSTDNFFNIFETIDISGNKSYYCMGYSQSILSYITASVPGGTTIVSVLTYCTYLTEFVNTIRANGDDVKALCVGRRNIFIHTTQGKVYGIGLNGYKQLANGNNQITQTIFVECSDIATEKTNNNAEVLFVLTSHMNVMVIFKNKTTGKQYAKGWGYNAWGTLWANSGSSLWYVDCTYFNSYVADNTYEAIDAYSPNFTGQTVIQFKKVADGTTEYRYSGLSGIHAGSSNGSTNQLNQPCDLINDWITANPSDEFVCSYHNGSASYGTNMFIRHNTDDGSKRFFAVGLTLGTPGATYNSVIELTHLNYTPGDAKYTIDGVTYDPVYFWPGATGYFIGLSLPPASFPAISTLNTTITAAAFNALSDKKLQLSGQVVASTTEGATTIFKAFATTQQGLTPDQVRDLINDPVNAAAVYNESDFSTIVTVPKVMDITGAVYDSSAVNYAHVYLYGTDGVNEKHDALSYAVLDDNIGVFTNKFMNQIPLAEAPANQFHYMIPAHLGYSLTVLEVGSFITNDSTTWLFTTPTVAGGTLPLVFDLSNNYTQISFYVGIGEDDIIGGMQQQANSNGVTITVQVSNDNKATWTHMQGKLNDTGSLVDINNLLISPASTAYLRVNNFDLTGMTHMQISTGTNGSGQSDQVYFVNTSVTQYTPPNPMPHTNISNAYWSRFYKQAYADGTAFSSVANIDSVYAPIAFTADVDLTSDPANVAAFVAAHSTVVSNDPIERYAVGTTGEETVLTHAYANIEDPTVTVPILENWVYQLVVAAQDSAGNVGVGTSYKVPFVNYGFGSRNLSTSYKNFTSYNESSYITLSDNYVGNHARGPSPRIEIWRLDGSSSISQTISSISGNGALVMNDNILFYANNSRLHMYYRDSTKSEGSQWTLSSQSYVTSSGTLDYGYNGGVYENTFVFAGTGPKLYIISVTNNGLVSTNPPTFEVTEFADPSYLNYTSYQSARIHKDTIVFSIGASDRTLNSTGILRLKNNSWYLEHKYPGLYGSSVDIYENTMVVAPWTSNNSQYPTSSSVYERLNGTWSSQPTAVLTFPSGSGFGVHGLSIYANNIVLGALDTSRFALLFSKDSNGVWNNSAIQLAYPKNDSPWVVKINKNIVALGRTASIMVYKTDQPTFETYEITSLSAISTLNTTITTAAFNKTLQMTSEVVASNTKGANTTFKAFATTQQGLTPDQVRDLINDPVNAAAVYNESDFTAGTAVTVPKVLADNGNVYDSSAVNYAHVYLYGTDGVNAKNDALSYASIVAGDNLPHVDITNVSSAVTSGVLTVTGTVFSSVANVTGGVRAAVFDPASFDLAGADQSALASFVNANGTDLSLTTVVYAVGSFTDFSLSTYFSNIDVGYTTGSLVDGNMYRVVVAAADATGNVGVGVDVPPFGTSLINYASLSRATLDSIGSGWTQIKYLPGTSTTWFPGTDNLEGFPGTEFLFTTGDFSRWLVCDQFQVNGEEYSNALRTITRSSISASPYQARWYHRSVRDAPHDPYISLEDYSVSQTNGTMMYIENSIRTALNSIHPTGMYVFVR